MRDVSVVAGDGTRLYVEEHGDPGAEVTVVLAHGWTLDRRSWRRQLADLPAAVGTAAGAAGVPVRILAYDHRGHGRSDPAAPGTATIAQLGDDLAELLRLSTPRVPAGRVVLAGHSMGGMTIMALAERHPALFAERVGAVAFVSTSAGGLRRGNALLRGRVAGRLTERVVAGGNRPPGRIVSAVARRWLRRSLFGPDAGPVPVALTTEIIASHWPATLLAFRATFDDHERHAAVAGCAVPVVVLCGSGDRLCPPGHSRRIAAAAPGAELVVCPGAGHMLMLERPAEVTGRIAALVHASHASHASHAAHAVHAAPHPPQ